MSNITNGFNLQSFFERFLTFIFFSFTIDKYHLFFGNKFWRINELKKCSILDKKLIMSHIRIFSEFEKIQLDKITEILNNNQSFQIVDYLNERKEAIEKLAESISLYPPIIDNHNDISLIYESAEQHIIELANCKREDIYFNVPTKAVLGKSFLVAKINFFYLIFYFTKDIFSIQEFQNIIKKIINEIMVILLAEEVFIELLIDKHISPFIKTKAVRLLFDIWEYRLELSIKSFVPLLINMWDARKNFEPVYGTLMGTAEYFMFASNVDQQINDFISEYNFEDDEDYSILEFLFGLSYENISILKNKMNEQDISVVKKDQILEMLNLNKLHTGSEKEDPRDFYGFFIERKNNAIYRSQYDQKGPKRTLEEHIMLFLLKKS